MPMVSLKFMAGAARSMVVASARTTAAKITVRACGRKVRGEDRELGTRVGPGGESYRVRVDFRNDAQHGDLKKRQAPKGISLFLSSMQRNRYKWRGRNKKHPFKGALREVGAGTGGALTPLLP